MGRFSSQGAARHSARRGDHHWNGCGVTVERKRLDFVVAQLAYIRSRLSWYAIPLRVPWMVGLSRRSYNRDLSYGYYSTLPSCRIRESKSWTSLWRCILHLRFPHSRFGLGSRVCFRPWWSTPPRTNRSHYDDYARLYRCWHPPPPTQIHHQRRSPSSNWSPLPAKS